MQKPSCWTILSMFLIIVCLLLACTVVGYLLLATPSSGIHISIDNTPFAIPTIPMATRVSTPIPPLPMVPTLTPQPSQTPLPTDTAVPTMEPTIAPSQAMLRVQVKNNHNAYLCKVLLRPSGNNDWVDVLVGNQIPPGETLFFDTVPGWYDIEIYICPEVKIDFANHFQISSDQTSFTTP